MEKTFMARKMEKVGPNQMQRFTGCGRSAGGTGARTGERRNAHGTRRTRGRSGEGKRGGEVGDGS